MTEASWQRSMADFMVELRAALPSAEIVHDVLWFKGDARPDIQRELAAASAVAIENATTTGVGGTYGAETLAGFVERGQVAGTAAVLRTPPSVTPPPIPTPVAPVGTPTPEPAPGPSATPAPRKPVKKRSSGKAKAHSAGAAGRNATRTTVSLARARVSGKVVGAVSGFVRLTVQRRRGIGWVTVRRAKDSVSKRGTYARDIAPLTRDTYRVVASFVGTGTARPSRSPDKTRSL